MKGKIRLILLSVAAAVAAGYLVVGVIIPYTLPDERTCESLHIIQTDSAQRQYVSNEELVDLLQSNGLYPVGKPMKHVPLETIEQTILAHPMIRTAECYTKTCSSVQVRTSQRVPKLRVVTPYECYWIDTDRKKMPFLPNTSTRVMNVTGHVGLQQAQNELFDMVDWIEHNRFWRQRITFIEIQRPNDIRIHQTDSLTIRLGDISHFAEKMANLQCWYKNGADTLGTASYHEVDVRFQHQVVAHY